MSDHDDHHEAVSLTENPEDVTAIANAATPVPTCASRPLTAPAGTEERIRQARRRAARGEPICQDGDATWEGRDPAEFDLLPPSRHRRGDMHRSFLTPEQQHLAEVIYRAQHRRRLLAGGELAPTGRGHKRMGRPRRTKPPRWHLTWAGPHGRLELYTSNWTRSEARAAAKKAWGMARRERLPIGVVIERVAAA